MVHQNVISLVIAPFQNVKSSIRTGRENVTYGYILIHNPTQELHNRAVLSRLQNVDVTLNDKCEFSKQNKVS